MSEVAGKEQLFTAYRVDATALFAQRDDDPEYYDFLDEGPEATAQRIPGLAADREKKLWEAYGTWWAEHAPGFAQLAADRKLMDLRGRLVTGFTRSVGDVGVLDEYTTAGIMADWWTANRYDLKALVAGGFERVLAGWVDSVEAIVDPALPPTEEGDTPAKKPTVSGADRRRAMDHPVVRALIPEFLDAVSSADTAVTEADAAYRAALEAVTEAKPAPVADAEDDADTDADEPSDGDTEATAPVSQEEIARLEKVLAARKRELAAAKKKRKALDDRFLKDLRAAAEVAVATSGDAERVVLEVLDGDLSRRLGASVASGRRELVAAFRRWAEKYAVSLEELEAESDGAAGELAGWLKELGYAR